MIFQFAMDKLPPKDIEEIVQPSANDDYQFGNISK